ncbi:Malto-oligosyltrehalose trehalohydrolase [Dyadobacter sp. CECT 9275]|uniref:Malto-oligosyltrehalose trehalohydrolase n=1 Tax=Dyadobacter helix TaxID=2822344 RepID=A0A916JJ65_9BACT|nr:malto-oligosyltrehalose trehalohydrolase [Dyadobacter sp. CECT 9275]CAG5018440.1 Malto-oligosyltrehalose trehalohydrolase [Dyadobacter sp. CECT 9275]
MELRKPGVTFIENNPSQVVLWVPEASSAGFVLMEDGQRIPMIPGEYGYWTLEHPLSPGDRYQFIINGEKTLPDPASLSQPEGVHGPSEVVDLTFDWTDTHWKNVPLADYIIYEVHTGTFTDEGTFAAMEEKLDYLVSLGITAIEMMPVAQFPGDRNWGYDGVFPYCVQHSYGGAKALQQLVDTCHSKGLAVILDVVYNHLGPEGNYLGEFAPYFTDKYHTPWGSAINFDDAWCDGVRKYYLENALMWFRDFHIDALRLDAVHAIKDLSPLHVLQEMRQQADALSIQTGRPYYLIAELDLNDTRFINPQEKGGFGLHTQWIDEFHHALRVSAGQERSSYYADFDGVVSLSKAYRDAYVFNGIYSEHRKKKFGMPTDNLGEQFIVFSQNHDQVGNRMLGERTSALVSYEMQKLMAGAVLVSPYLPMLFMGEEYGESNPFLYFVSHTDPELAEAVRQGRKNEFSAFHIEGEAPDPVAEKTFVDSRLQWGLIQKEPHQTMLRYYRRLIDIRKRQAALHMLNRKDSTVECLENQRTIILLRQHKMQDVVCLLNFSKEPQHVHVNLYAAVWHKLIASSDEQWGGAVDFPDTIAEEITLELAPESITIYTNDL